MKKAMGNKPTKVRWLLVGLAFLAIVINYVDRANLSVALPHMREDLGLSSAQSGLILGAFFWTYAMCQIPVGILVDKFGARAMLSVAVVWWSVCTMLTALVRGAGSLVGMRLMLGVGESGAFPAATKFVERWFPPTERGLATGIYDCGARGGTLIALPICTALIAAYGWRATFVVLGAVGLIWVVAWLLVSSEFPAQNRHINDAEVQHIQGNTDTPKPSKTKIKWGKLFTSKTMWAMGLGFSCQGYVIYFFITWYPTYLVQERGFSLLQLGIYGILPGVAGLIGSWFGGWISDRMARKYGLSFARKTCIVVGMALGASIGLAGLADQAWIALALLSLAFFGVSAATSSILSLPADFSPRGKNSVAGTVAGFQTGVGNLAGIASPAVMGYLRDATGSFNAGLVSASVIALVGCLIYMFGVDEVKPEAFDHVIDA